MSFLNELKAQARALQVQQENKTVTFDANVAQCEVACRTVLQYLQDVARQLNVIAPAAPHFTLDGKTPWPAMKLTEFRVDSRMKTLRDRGVFDYVAMGWRIVPQIGKPVSGVVSVNFPPDLERVQSRLALGPVKHERRDIRHPEKNTLQAIDFEYLTETRGNVVLTPDHDKGQVSFRLMNVSGFGVHTVTLRPDEVRMELLDELAKLIVSQPSRFV